MKAPTRTLLALIPLLLLIYLLIQARVQILFERFLSSSSISFADFPPPYANALIKAQKENSQPEYTFGSLDPDTRNATIPPIIHFIWFRHLYSSHLDISTIPTEGSHAPTECAEKNPGFTVNVWNATSARDLLEDHYSWFLPTYDNYRHPIQRVDAIKYFLLWHYGGIYIDMDMTCRRALNPLLPFPAWLPKASPLGVNNDLMAARPRHPLVGAMVHKLQSRDRNLLFPYLTIFWSTGPQFTSDVLKMWWRGIDSMARLPAQDRFRVLPQEFYSEKYTFFGHMPGGTWHGGEVAVILWLVDRPWVVAVVPAAVLVLLAAWLRWRRRRALRKRYVVAGDSLEQSMAR